MTEYSAVSFEELMMRIGPNAGCRSFVVKFWAFLMLRRLLERFQVILEGNPKGVWVSFCLLNELLYFFLRCFVINYWRWFYNLGEFFEKYQHLLLGTVVGNGKAFSE